MLGPNLPKPEFSAAANQVRADFISFVEKHFQGRNSRCALKRLGLTKDYVECNLVIVLHICTLADNQHHHLVLHRVPNGRRKVDKTDLSGNCGVPINRAVSLNVKSDSMFVVGYLGEFSNLVVSSGISLSTSPTRRRAMRPSWNSSSCKEAKRWKRCERNCRLSWPRRSRSTHGPAVHAQVFSTSSTQ